jgi:hypothetical protein
MLLADAALKKEKRVFAATDFSRSLQISLSCHLLALLLFPLPFFFTTYSCLFFV